MIVKNTAIIAGTITAGVLSGGTAFALAGSAAAITAGAKSFDKPSSDSVIQSTKLGYEQTGFLGVLEALKKVLRRHCQKKKF